MLKQISLYCIILLGLLTSTSAQTKIMPLGDSITWDWYYGDSRTDAYRHSYRSYLWYLLNDHAYDVDFVGTRSNGEAVSPEFDGDNEAYTGYATFQIEPLIYSALQETSPDVILLHIGTNDSMYSTPSEAVDSLSSLLDEIDRYEKNYGHHITVLLARIIYLPKVASWVPNFNDYLDDMVEDRIEDGDDIVVVDMESGAGLDYSRDLIDGIHPTSAGYEKMADLWYSTLTKVINKNEAATLVPIYHMLLVNP